MGTGVKPCKASSESLDLELSVSEELLVYGRYLVFSTCRRFDVFGDFDNLVRVEIQCGPL